MNLMNVDKESRDTRRNCDRYSAKGKDHSGTFKMNRERIDT